MHILMCSYSSAKGQFKSINTMWVLYSHYSNQSFKDKMEKKWLIKL